MPTSDDGVEDHVSAAFRRENVGVPRQRRTKSGDAPKRARAARSRLPACRWPRCSRSGSPSSSSFFVPRGDRWMSTLPHDVIEESERRWAYVVAGVIWLYVRRDHLQQRALGRATSVERGNDRRQPPSSCRRIRGGPISARRFSRTDR